MTIWPLYDTGLAADHAVHLGQVVKRPDRLKPDNGQAAAYAVQFRQVAQWPDRFSEAP
jgi:hypothetical protein